VSVITASNRARAKTSPRRFTANFRLLMGGSFVSMLGSRVSSIACPLLVLALTGSAADAGRASFATLAPSVLAYLPAGALLIDRWDPRKVMLRSEMGRGLVRRLASPVIGRRRYDPGLRFAPKLASASLE
jgi:hypothetical protein